MPDHVAQLAIPSAFSSRESKPVSDGISVIIGRRHGSRTDEGIEYRFDSDKLTETEASDWLTTRGIQVLSFSAARMDAPWQDEDGTWNLPGVDILRVGPANASKGGKVDIDDAFLSEVEQYTNANIDALKPPLKFGHGPQSESLFPADGAPALGWVDRVRKVGDRLVADVRKVPDQLYQAMKQGRWRRQSAEILRDWVSPGGDKCPRVLKAIALLGSELPAIQTLNDLVMLTDDTQVVCFVDAAAPAGDSQGENSNEGSAMTPEEIKALVQQLIAETLASKEEPTPEGESGMTDEETKTMTALREQITDLRLTAALNARKITPAEVAKQKPLLMTLTADQANNVLDTIDAREPAPDKTKPAGSTESKTDPLAGLKGEEKLIALANAKGGDFAQAFSQVCNENPDDYAAYRAFAFRPL